MTPFVFCITEQLLLAVPCFLLSLSPLSLLLEFQCRLPAGHTPHHTSSLLNNLNRELSLDTCHENIEWAYFATFFLFLQSKSLAEARPREASWAIDLIKLHAPGRINVAKFRSTVRTVDLNLEVQQEPASTVTKNQLLRPPPCKKREIL